jgi:hypothetical protein
VACTVFRSIEENACLFLVAMGKDDDESATEFYGRFRAVTEKGIVSSRVSSRRLLRRLQ